MEALTQTESRPATTVPFLRDKESKTKKDADALVGAKSERFPNPTDWDSKRRPSSAALLWRTELQDVLAKTIAMIRGSKEYQGYQQRARAHRRGRGNGGDKYIQAMNYEYKGQE